MSGYDSPWMLLGLREDGYPVLDPRDYRNVPTGQRLSAQQSAELSRASGGVLTKREIQKYMKWILNKRNE